MVCWSVGSGTIAHMVRANRPVGPVVLGNLAGYCEKATFSDCASSRFNGNVTLPWPWQANFVV